MPRPLVLALMLAGCAAPSFVQKGVHEGLDIAYRWNHPAGKPPELLLKLSNTTSMDRTLHLDLGLYYQGRMVETFTADTCIRAGQTLNGKLNGFYFTPTSLSPEQASSDDTQLEIAALKVEEQFACP